MQKFIENFCEILEETDVTTISSNTYFKELEEWSSLMALSLIAMVDENYNISLGAEDIRNAKTLEDLYKIIQEKNK